MTAEMPERIWAGSCEALGAPDTGYWYPVRTPSTPTEFVSASTHARAMEALREAEKALRAFDAAHMRLFATGQPLMQGGKAINHSGLNEASRLTDIALSRIAALTPGCVKPSDTLSSGEETS